MQDEAPLTESLKVLSESIQPLSESQQIVEQIEISQSYIDAKLPQPKGAGQGRQFFYEA